MITDQSVNKTNFLKTPLKKSESNPKVNVQIHHLKPPYRCKLLCLESSRMQSDREQNLAVNKIS